MTTAANRPRPSDAAPGRCPGLATFVVRRLVVSAITLVLSSFLVFVLVANSGDPLSDLRTDTSAGREPKIARRVELLHLDEPVPRRYLSWLGGVAGCVAPGRRCDLGRNIHEQDVATLLIQAAGTTLRLVTAALLLAALLGVGVGVISSLRQYSGFDYTITAASFLFFSLPVFWVAVLFKQYLAIDVNDWYADPRIGPGSAAVLSALSGLTWGAIVGGPRRRRWITRGAAAAVTFGALTYLSAVSWFTYPALGPGPIAVLALGAAAVIANLSAGDGDGRRAVLRSCLATAGVASVAQFAVTPWLQDPAWASWSSVLLLMVGAIGVASAIGWTLGGLDRASAMRACGLTAIVAGALVVVDVLLRAVPGYAAEVDGRIVATVGAQTPDFEGTFWERQLDLGAHLLLPTLSILLVSFATYSRYSRAAMLEVMNADYIRTARAKGLAERTVVLRHALRKALIPVTTLTAIDFGTLIAGAVVTEYVFGWQGMGSLFVSGLLQTDPHPVMAFYLVTAVSVAVFNLVADVAYAYLDPRIRLS